jgi:hypothetical protein
MNMSIKDVFLIWIIHFDFDKNLEITFQKIFSYSHPTIEVNNSLSIIFRLIRPEVVPI